MNRMNHVKTKLKKLKSETVFTPEIGFRSFLGNINNEFKIFCLIRVDKNINWGHIFLLVTIILTGIVLVGQGYANLFNNLL